ncbi:MAG: T9SS type A sorting domain-containing protein [Bacteroidetes bacterium]|nr:T9SS type A sorting domain-containing protein [Bacteroidota bacterium]
MSKFYLAFFMMLIPVFVGAQTSSPDVLATGGGFATGAGFTNSFTVGQGSITPTYSAGTFILTQGFQQPVDFSTGIVPLYMNDQLGTFPNPNNGQFFVEYNLENNSDVIIEAFNNVGQLVYSNTNSQTSGHQVQQIDLSAQPNEIYFIRCTISCGANITIHTSTITLSH